MYTYVSPDAFIYTYYTCRYTDCSHLVLRPRMYTMGAEEFVEGLAVKAEVLRRDPYVVKSSRI